MSVISAPVAENAADTDGSDAGTPEENMNTLTLSLFVPETNEYFNTIR